MWVARDKDIVSDHGGTLNLFENFPYRVTVGIKNPKEFWSDYSTGGDEMELDENEHLEFKNLKWEDEPIEVELISIDKLDTELNNMFCQLCIDYNIPDEVADRIINKFKKNVGSKR